MLVSNDLLRVFKEKERNSYDRGKGLNKNLASAGV